MLIQRIPGPATADLRMSLLTLASAPAVDRRYRELADDLADDMRTAEATGDDLLRDGCRTEAFYVLRDMAVDCLQMDATLPDLAIVNQACALADKFRPAA